MFSVCLVDKCISHQPVEMSGLFITWGFAFPCCIVANDVQCTTVLYSCRFNNHDILANSHQSVMDIEPTFPHEHIPLMQEEET